MAKPNYQYEKRQRDLAKKNKQDEKRRQKLVNKTAEEGGEDAAETTQDSEGPPAASPDTESAAGV